MQTTNKPRKRTRNPGEIDNTAEEYIDPRILAIRCNTCNTPLQPHSQLCAFCGREAECE